jgi:hypothetical protein
VVNRDGYMLRSLDVNTRAIREWTRVTGRMLNDTFLRGWLPNDTGIFVIRRSQLYNDRTWDLDIEVVPRDGPTRIAARIAHASVLTLRIDPAGRLAYVTRAEQGIHNLYSVVLATGEMTRLTDNTLEGVSFSGVALAGDQLVGVRHEQRRALWVIETRASR